MQQGGDPEKWVVQTVNRLMKWLHLRGAWRILVLFLVNRIFAGTSMRFFEIKRKLLNSCGFSIGSGTRVVGPIACTGSLTIGQNCWIGKHFCVNGNGTVRIGDRCDIAPEVTFQTGSHEIGTAERRAGKGIVSHQTVGNGVWIGGRVTIIGTTRIGDASVIAGCACVVRDVEANTLVGGVPAKMIRRLDDASAQAISE